MQSPKHFSNKICPIAESGECSTSQSIVVGDSLRVACKVNNHDDDDEYDHSSGADNEDDIYSEPLSPRDSGSQINIHNPTNIIVSGTTTFASITLMIKVKKHFCLKLTL